MSKGVFPGGRACEYCSYPHPQHAPVCPNNPKRAITHSEIDWDEESFCDKIYNNRTAITTTQLHKLRTEAHAAGVADERARVRRAVMDMCIRVNRLNEKHPGSEYIQGRAAAFAEVMRSILDPKEAE